MGYELKNFKLESLMKKAISDKEFSSYLEKYGLTVDHVGRSVFPILLENISEIVRLVNPRLDAEIDEHQNKIKDLEKIIDSDKWPERLRDLPGVVRYLIENHGILLLVVMACAATLVSLANLLTNDFTQFQFIDYTDAGLILTGILILILYSILVYRRVMRIKKSELNEELKETIKSERNKIVLVVQKIDDAIIRNGIKQFIRELFNRFEEPNYDLNLVDKNAQGLSEVTNFDYETPTEARKALNRLFESMSGGSIGLAGPRGAGKTTLMKSFCRPIKDEKELSVFISVPVKYDSRDFILHIFSSICKEVMKQNGEDPDRENEVNYLLSSKTLFVDIVRALFRWRRGILVLCFFSLMVIGLSFLWSRSILYNANVSISATATPLNTAVTSTPFPALTSTPMPTLVPGQTAQSTQDVEQGPTLSEIFRSLGVEPKSLFSISIPFFLITLFTYYYVSRVSRTDWFRYTLHSTSRRSSPSRAQKIYTDIRYQQSYSSGSSGSFKLPVALEANLEHTRSLSRYQMSLPEIVEEYKDFVNDLIAKENYRINIGIDELDKMASLDNARSFINEIKAIFGIPNCFYLVSVSENAMSNFERRGLPFRDEFDSAFDHVIYVDYLDCKTSQDLLRKRVIGLPPKFMHLCYVMSGGLPRDLIRVCRSIYEYAQFQLGEVSFVETCKNVIQKDIKGKIRATNITIGDLDIPGTLYSFLPFFNQLDLNVENTSEFKLILENMKKILSEDIKQDFIIEKTPLNDPDLAKVEIAKIKTFQSIVSELISYIYFSLTVQDFFTAKDWNGVTNYGELLESKSGNDLTLLARCKQSFAINPQHAFALIGEFRKSYRWDVLDTNGWQNTTKPGDDVKETKEKEEKSDIR